MSHKRQGNSYADNRLFLSTPAYITCIDMTVPLFFRIRLVNMVTDMRYIFLTEALGLKIRENSRQTERRQAFRGYPGSACDAGGTALGRAGLGRYDFEGERPYRLDDIFSLSVALFFILGDRGFLTIGSPIRQVSITLFAPIAAPTVMRGCAGCGRGWARPRSRCAPTT